MAKFKKGDSVRQIVKPIEGTVEAFQVDQEHGNLQVLVKWKDEEGVEHSRFFNEDEVEVQA